MDSVTLYWALATTALAGVQLFFQRMVAKEGRDGAFSGFIMYAVSGLLALLLLVWVGTIPVQWELAALFGIVSGLTHGFGNYLRIEALKNIDSVLYFPINKVLGPIIVVLGGVWLFSEPLTIKEYVGIAFSLTVPLLLISNVEHARQMNLRLGLNLLVVSTVLTSIAMIFSKYGTNADPNVLLLLLFTQAAGMVSSLAVIAKQKRERGVYFAHLDKRDVMLSILIGILGFLSYYTFLNALTTGYVSLVYVIHAHYILIPIVLSVWWYKEHINLRKLIAVVVSCLAIGIIAI